MSAAEPKAIVEGSLDWSLLARADLPKLAELREAMDYFDNPIDTADLAQMTADFERDSRLDGFLATVGRDKAGTLVAYGWLHPSVSPELESHLWIETGVHPAWRHRRIQRRLIEWAVARAKEWQADRPEPKAPLWLGYLVEEGFVGLAGALEEAGFSPRRWYYDAHADLAAGVFLNVDVPPEVRLATYTAELGEQTRVAHNLVFGAREGAHPVGKDEWGSWLGQTNFGLSRVALDATSGAVVGYALNTILEGGDGIPAEGWTERFGVMPHLRGRGVGSALLVASLHAFVEAGLTGAGVGVDTDDPLAADKRLDRKSVV
jgi:GNAT superfamily N-acetyltransferase